MDAHAAQHGAFVITIMVLSPLDIGPIDSLLLRFTTYNFLFTESSYGLHASA